MSARWIGFVLLLGIAGGYAFRQLVAEWRPAPSPPVDTAPQEWTPGEYAGYPNAYHVRPLE